MKTRLWGICCFLSATYVGVCDTNTSVNRQCSGSEHESEGYCPSTCAVETEISRFEAETEDATDREWNTLNDIQHLIGSINSFQYSEGFTDLDDLEEFKRSTNELALNASQHLEDYINLMQDLERQRAEIDDLVRELNSLAEGCSSICSSTEQDYEENDRDEYVAPRSSDGCGGDNLCGRAAYRSTSSVLHRDENGVPCHSFITPQARSCAELYRMNYRKNGIYRIRPTKRTPGFKVFCDMQDSGGGWTVFQRRVDGTLNFNRTWKEYERGFGNASCTREFWLGNKKLESIGLTGFQTARFLVTDWEGETRVAQYSYFKVNRASLKYRLQISAFQERESNATDAMTVYHTQNNARFTTYDQRHTDPRHAKDCDMSYGGWWQNTCTMTNLNGYYHHGGFYDSTEQPRGVIWVTWKGGDYSLRETVIKIRPLGFPDD